MKDRTLEQKALFIIEILASDDLCEGLSLDIAGCRPLNPSQDDLLTLAKKLSTIYSIAHATRADAVCYEVHEGWRDDMEKMYEQLKVMEEE